MDDDDFTGFKRLQARQEAAGAAYQINSKLAVVIVSAVLNGGPHIEARYFTRFKADCRKTRLQDVLDGTTPPFGNHEEVADSTI